MMKTDLTHKHKHRQENRIIMEFLISNWVTSQQRGFVTTKQMVRSVHPSLAGRMLRFRSLLVRERGLYTKFESAIRRRLGLTDKAGGASPRRHYRRREEGKRTATMKSSLARWSCWRRRARAGEARRVPPSGCAGGGAGRAETGLLERSGGVSPWPLDWMTMACKYDTRLEEGTSVMIGP